MNTLTGIEAERVVQILKHASDRLKLLSYIPSVWDDDILEELTSEASSTVLKRYWTAEEQLKDLSDGSYADAGGRDISVIKQAHRAARAACRTLQSDRKSLQILMDSRPESQSESSSKFIRYLNDLTSHVHSKLTTTVEDEAANRTLLHELTERERHTEESRDALQAKLAEVCEEKDRVTFGLDQTLRKLQVELQDLNSHNKVELESVQNEMNDAIVKATTDHELRVRHLQDQVDGLERQLTEVMERNKDEEQRHRRDKCRAETNLNVKIRQYDEDMASRKVALEALNATFEEESAEYAVLSEYFDRVDKNIAFAKDEDEILMCVQRGVDFGLYTLDHAAKLIQKIARGKLARATVVAKTSKKGGKKKGKK